ncbi:hypothetical protein GCM10023187_45240 [Nibrella viscosa]|uniref:Aminopeptidase n=1 Tax=Nibrella viscosa TaxID=1084524 RepID=A0ABP8KTQ9_9BACT
MWKKIITGVLVICVIVAIWQRELLSYGWMQAKGQLKILWNTQPVEKVLANPAYPDSLKRKIELIQEIKRFAIDSIGLNPSGSYTTYYEQHGQPILWVITASEPYRLVAHQWSFPFLGTFSYKGFFEKPRAEKEEAELKKEGLDTRIGEVSAWSTLGFFNDPILSSMLERPVGRLAELIIHELTHGTLFIKNSLEYNENLADFVGEYGALRFMAQKYGKESTTYKAYLAERTYDERYDEHILRGTQTLDSLYRTFGSQTPVAEKQRLKTAMIEQIVETVDTLTDGQPKLLQPLTKKRKKHRLKLPNNAYFVGYLTYRKQQNRFRAEFEERFNGDFKRYFSYLKETYPSL